MIEIKLKIEEVLIMLKKNIFLLKFINFLFIILFISFCSLYIYLFYTPKIIYEFSLDVFCTHDYYDCNNFTSKDYAETAYYYCIGKGVGDIHNLDPDNNGKPCENIKSIWENHCN